MNVDVIGDVHGHCSMLTALLRKMGYRETGGSWRHPDRTAVFVGDLVDRGPEQVETVELVRAMVDAGQARCIMGNHEFNAIAWTTPDPHHEGGFLRPHNKGNNHTQHKEFLRQVVQNSPRHEEYIRWFRTLPLWLDLGGLRVVHACWDQQSMDVLKARGLAADQTLPESLILEAGTRGTDAYRALEVVCKGPEATLPEAQSFHDKDGTARHEVRVKWWADDLSSFRHAAHAPKVVVEKIPESPLPEPWQSFRYAGPPVVFGHYWLSGTPAVLSKKFACVDFSVAKGGPLVAYRWEGEEELKTENLVWVGSKSTD